MSIRASSVFALAGVALLAWLTIGPVQAQSAETRRARGSDKPSSEFERVLSAAMAEYERSNWTEARALFEAAHELAPSARTLRAIGLSAFEEKSYTAAIFYLTQAKQDPRKPLTPEQRTQVEETIARASEFVARYTLELSPEHATLLLDGRAPVIMEGQLLLDPGAHQLLVRAEGHRDDQRALQARPRTQERLKIALRPQGEAVAAQQAPRVPAAAGAAPARGGSLSVKRKTAIALMPVAAVGVAVGIGMGVRAMNKHQESDCTATCPSAGAKQLNEQARTAGYVSTGMFVLGGAALASSLLLYFWPGERARHARLQVAPALAGSSLGVSAQGQF